MSTDTGYLPRLTSRESYFDHLDGLTTTEIGEHTDRSARTRIKTYMLETARYDRAVPALDHLFPGDVRLHRLDDTLYRVEDGTRGGRVIGLIEVLDPRYPVLYTTLPVDRSGRWVRRAVDHNPWVDRLWLSSPILFELGKYARRTAPDHRYVRLGFEHQAWDKIPTDLDAADEGIDDEGHTFDESGETPLSWIEHRQSKVCLTARLALCNTTLQPLLEMYDPQYALVQLQIPGGEGGGHRFYHDGRATNWSDSFIEHRAAVALVVRLYRNVTSHVEDRLWVDTTRVGEYGFSVTGAPVTSRFSDQLGERTFNRFVDLALRRRTSRFRIGGYVTRRGPTKVHPAGIDHHLWQPFLLRATSHHLLGSYRRGPAAIRSTG